MTIRRMSNEEGIMNMTMNRRNFLKGAIATGAIAATGAALSGCAKTCLLYTSDAADD